MMMTAERTNLPQRVFGDMYFKGHSVTRATVKLQSSYSATYLLEWGHWYVTYAKLVNTTAEYVVRQISITGSKYRE